MEIIPCNNCKRQRDCSVPRFLRNNTHLGLFALADKMYEMPIKVEIVSMGGDNKDKVVLECKAVSFIKKPAETFEALVDSKPQDHDCCIGAALRDRCKKGDCGGCR